MGNRPRSSSPGARLRGVNANKIPPEARVLGQGRYVTLLDEGGWEYAVRPHVTGIVVIVAITDDDHLVMVQQHRAAVHNQVIELPAGMVGDTDDRRDESLADAAARELTEETGYEAREVVPLAEGPIAVGMSNEIVSFFHARGLTRVGPGGGVESEQITVHTIPLRELMPFLKERAAAGLGIDPKIYAGLFLVGASVPR
jgi:ADP-ribose pyrophosphatase